MTQENNNGSTIFSPSSSSSSSSEKPLLTSAEKVPKGRDFHAQVMKQVKNRKVLNTKAKEVAESIPEPFKTQDYQPLKVPGRLIEPNVSFSPIETKGKKRPIVLRNCSGQLFSGLDEYKEKVQKYFSKLEKEGSHNKDATVYLITCLNKIVKDQVVNGTIEAAQMYLFIDNCQIMVDSFEGELFDERKKNAHHIGNLWKYVFGLVIQSVSIFYYMNLCLSKRGKQFMNLLSKEVSKRFIKFNDKEDQTDWKFTMPLPALQKVHPVPEKVEPAPQKALPVPQIGSIENPFEVSDEEEVVNATSNLIQQGTQLQSQNEEAEKIVVQQKEVVEEAKKSKNQLLDMVKKLTKIVHSNPNLMKENENELRAQMKGLNDEISNFENGIQDLKNQIELKRREIEDRKKKIQEIQGNLSQLQQIFNILNQT